jgi:hypothetical protein
MGIETPGMATERHPSDKKGKHQQVADHRVTV